MSTPDTHHLEAADIAAFIDGTLETSGRARIVAHLADCAECRQEIAEVRAAQRTSRAGWWWVSGVAAAVLAGIIVIGPLLAGGDAAPRLRDTAAVPVIVMIAPMDTVPADETLVFAWRAAAPEAIYTLILMEEDGEVIWRLDATRDTTAVLPARVSARRGTTALYTLDARLPDGRLATSGTRRVHLAK